MSAARDSSGETAGNSGGNLDRWLAGFRGEAARQRASFNEARERSVRLGRGVDPLATQHRREIEPAPVTAAEQEVLDQAERLVTEAAAVAPPACRA